MQAPDAQTLEDVQFEPPHGIPSGATPSPQPVRESQVGTRHGAVGVGQTMRGCTQPASIAQASLVHASLSSQRRAMPRH